MNVPYSCLAQVGLMNLLNDMKSAEQGIHFGGACECRAHRRQGTESARACPARGRAPLQCPAPCARAGAGCPRPSHLVVKAPLRLTPTPARPPSTCQIMAPSHGTNPAAAVQTPTAGTRRCGPPRPTPSPTLAASTPLPSTGRPTPSPVRGRPAASPRGKARGAGTGRGGESRGVLAGRAARGAHSVVASAANAAHGRPGLHCLASPAVAARPRAPTPSTYLTPPPTPSPPTQPGWTAR